MEREDRTWDARPEPGRELDRRIGRRAFLGGAAALTGAAAFEALSQEALAHEALYRKANAVFANRLLQIDASEKPSFSIDILRREDFLFLRADGYNLIRSGQRLMPKKSREEARLVITFVPQHIAEQAYAEKATPAARGQVRALVAAPSRLAFIVPKGGISLTLDSLLAWADLEPALAAAAAHLASAKGGAPTLTAPAADETAIELPWHLALSPTSAGRWSHDTEPVTLDGATEMWRTRLVTPGGLAELEGGAVRAVWSYDTQEGTSTLNSGTQGVGADPFTSSLSAFDRWQIVTASADFTTTGRADISARQLLLSARGGSLTSEGTWNAPKLPELTAWSHEASQGRDQFVKVVNRGFLFPFGHQVSLVKITQREFDEIGSETVGVLRQSIHLVVSDPLVSYDPAVNPGVANNGRDFPFRALELKDTSTPVLDQTFKDPSIAPPFVPTVGGGPISWHFVGTDWSGRTTSFVAQAMFVSHVDALNSSKMNGVRDAYNARASTDPLRTTDFGGKTLTFAESFTDGDTDLPAFGMTFAASPGAIADGRYPRFAPTLASIVNGRPSGAQVSVSMPAVEHASGAPLSGNARPTLAYYSAFVEAGFHSAESTLNKGNVFMQILGDASNATNLTFAGKNAGGVLTPNLQLEGLSRSLGPVADLDNISAGSFNPATVFQGLEGKLAARILGGVTLSDLLAQANILPDGPGASADVPNPQALMIKSTTKGDVATTIVSWTPTIRLTRLPDDPPPVITVRPEPAKPLKFNLTCTITTDATKPLNSSYSLQGDLENFVVNLVSTDSDEQFIAITFERFGFTSVSGGKPKIDVKIAGVNFAGALKFVEQLAALIGVDGGGGPNISDLADAISSDLSLKLPSIDVGILSISHLAIDTGFKLPFDGGAALFNFGFASSANHFTLAIGIFGGGGFLSLSIGTVGVKSIEASFEFGAMAALDIGVASGAVSLTAGFYFAYSVDVSKKKPVTTCVLSGFVKLTGNLTVLGIITLALEFDLSLTYMEAPDGTDTITGTATLVVSVSLLYFHKSVTMTASKTFVNSGSNASAHRAVSAGAERAAVVNGRHTFADQMTQADWTAYCQAFGPVS